MSHAHLRPGPKAEAAAHAVNAALLIDFDNVTLGIRSDLTKELKSLLNSDIIRGKVAVQRAYADWRRYPQYVVALSERSIDLIFAPAVGSTTKKNATDIRLAIDAMELVFLRPEIGTFILLSGDSDFSSLVIKLKEYGKYVIGVGIRESASDLLIQNCDEYFSYSDLAGLTKETVGEGVPRDPWELVQEAVAQMGRNRDVMRSDRLKQVMQQLDSNFDERNAGFNRFSKFVTEAGAKGLLRVTKLDNGQYEVAPNEGAAPAAPAPSRGGDRAAAAAETPRDGERRDEGGRRGRRGRGRGRDRDRTETPAADAAPTEAAAAPRADGLTLARAFSLMTDALSGMQPPVTHEALRLRMAALHGREDAMLEAGRFERLLRQANDAEVLDVRKTSDNEFEVMPFKHEEMRTRGALLLPSASDNEAAAAASGDTSPPLGLRFRRGSSRGPQRTAEIPLVGVVRVDRPAAATNGAVIADVPVVVESPAASAPAEAAPGKRPSRRGGVKSAKKAKAAAPAPKAEASKPAEAAKKSGRARATKAAKKKAE